MKPVLQIIALTLISEGIGLMVTIYDVANKAGVSPSTVSRVLNNHDNVKSETKKVVEQACKELNYVPNANASSLRKKNTRTLALIVPEIKNPFFISILEGFEERAGKSGYNTLVCNTNENSKKENDFINTIVAKRIDGVTISTVNKSSSHIQTIINRNIPVVLLDRNIDDLNVDVVCGDSYQGAIDLVNHLIGLGHKKIAIITGPVHLSTSRERVEGYKKALTDANIDINNSFIKIDKKSEGYSLERAYEMAEELLELSELPSAIFVGNNFMAFGVYQALKKRNLQVPDDMAIVCFDDLSFMYEIEPFFTTMRQPAFTMGKMAAEILVNKIEGKYENNRQKIRLQPELVVRRSCGVYKSGE
jgi:LacI family transcriptional regulator